MDKKILKEKLKKINEAINSEYQKEKEIGVLSGTSGIALFKFYYSKYTGDQNDRNIGIDILEDCIKKINSGYDQPTFCTGIAGFGWVLNHLEENNIYNCYCDELLPEVDEYLYSTMISDIKNGNYDFLHGAIGYAFYFLKRFNSTKSSNLKSRYKEYLLVFLDLLEKLSEPVYNDKSRWPSVLDHKTKEEVYNLSLSHGMSSIAGILIKLSYFDDFKIKSQVMLKKTINYIFDSKNQNQNFLSTFPDWIQKNGQMICGDRLAWCYGDLGIGVTLWNASIILKDQVLKNEAITIFKKASSRTLQQNSKVIDAGICHGSYGNAQIFFKMFKNTNKVMFKEAADFWIQDGLNKSIHENGLAGYKQYRGQQKKWIKKVSLLEGISGIGLTIINYLDVYETNWDECLMIS